MLKSDFLALRVGQTIYHQFRKNADGSRLRARVNGKVKEWKRTGAWLIPMKHGFRDCFYIGPQVSSVSRDFADPANWTLDDN